MLSFSKIRQNVLTVLAVYLMACPAMSQTSAVSGEPLFETVPMSLEQGRPLVELTIVGPSGQRSSGTFLVDTGGGAFIISESVADAAGLERGETFRSQGKALARVSELPTAIFGNYRLPLTPERVLISIGSDEGEKSATGLLPGHVLARHHVIFDYPAGTLTLATADSLEPTGRPLAMPVSEPMGFPRTEIEVAGQTFGMLLDTGPPATMLSSAVMDAWAAERPQWPRQEGALDEAAMLAALGGRVLSTMTAEQVGWAGFDLAPLTVAAQPTGTYERYMSSMMTDPVVGALGSNAFMPFRLELDYRNQTLYLSRAR
jgi:hypothetical protein